MLKVQVLDRCEYCDGEAYICFGEHVDEDGQSSPRYLTCPQCHGSGEMGKWVSLQEFAELLERAIALEPDWQELSRQKPVTQYQDSRDAAGI